MEEQLPIKKWRIQLLLIALILLPVFVLYFYFTKNFHNDKAPYKPAVNTYISLLSIKNEAWEEIKVLWEKEIDNISNSYSFSEAQKYHLSCEINAMSIVLQTLGLKMDEDNIIWLLKSDGVSTWSAAKMQAVNWVISETPSPIPESGIWIAGEDFYAKHSLPKWMYIWWNPDEWFVWDINGSQRKMTGYGINELPLIKIYNKLWFNTVQINERILNDNWLSAEEALKYLLYEVGHWNMVQLWWDYCTHPEYEDAELSMQRVSAQEIVERKWRKNTCNPKAFSKRDIYWYTPVRDNGYKRVDAFLWEHNFVLMGYKSNWEKMTHIKVYDTHTWFHTYHIEEWLRKWKTTNYRWIVIKKEDS